MNIHDVQQIPLAVHMTDPFVPQFGQVYVVGDRIERIVRAYHKHAELHDWFCIVKGAAKFVLVDDRPDSPTYRKYDIVVCSERAQSLLVVPPGIFHGWMSLQPDTIMVSTASHVYNREKPDETRVPPDTFNDLIGEDPWAIKGK